jgi:hypothetical protein
MAHCRRRNAVSRGSKPKAANKLAYRALRAIRLGIGADYAAGADLPLPASDKLLNDYQKLIEAGALQVLLDGRPYVETIINHGPGTRPTITRRPI